MARIAVFDYPGHAFAVQLSRQLARRGHTVRHLSFVGFQAPKGDLYSEAEDGRFEFVALHLDEPFRKYDFLKRRRQERRVGELAARAIAEFEVDIVLAGNAPLDAHQRVADWCLSSGAPMVYWLQDINSIAIERILSQRLGFVGRMIGWFYRAMERRMLRASAACVAITEDFIPLLAQWDVSRERIAVIENWAPIDDIPMLDAEQDWEGARGLSDSRVLIYAGTLSLKHDPEQLLALARRLAERGDATLIVASEGIGADYLTEHGADLPSLRVLPFQPFDVFPDMLASAEILVAVLEPDAGVFSVPSKVLSYFCAGRAVLASIPPTNLAAKLILRNQAGAVVEPGDIAAFVAAAEDLLDAPDATREMGRNARRYAEENFTIDDVARRFEAVFDRVLSDDAIAPARSGAKGRGSTAAGD